MGEKEDRRHEYSSDIFLSFNEKILDKDFGERFQTMNNTVTNQLLLFNLSGRGPDLRAFPACKYTQLHTKKTPKGGIYQPVAGMVICKNFSR